MAEIKLELNRKMDDNYAFFCPEASVHLSLSQPRAIASRLSSSILTALRFQTLIDVDGVVDIDRGVLKEIQEAVPEHEGVEETYGLQIDEYEKEEKQKEKEVAPKKQTKKRSTKIVSE